MSVCRFPNSSALYAYGKGCRCTRCRHAKSVSTHAYNHAERTGPKRQYTLPRLPWEPIRDELARRDITSVSAIARCLGVDRPAVYRWIDNGLTTYAADRVACRLGLHPVSVWIDYYEATAA